MMLKAFRTIRLAHIVFFCLGFISMYAIQRARSPIIVLQDSSINAMVSDRSKLHNYLYSPLQSLQRDSSNTAMVSDRSKLHNNHYTPQQSLQRELPKSEEKQGNEQQSHDRGVGSIQRKNRRQPVFTKISDINRYEISGSTKHNFSYCMVYKAATTSWLRIIRFLNGESAEVRSPYDIGKHRVHYYKAWRYIKYFTWQKDKKFLEDSFRLMAVRNPYTRLWSAYIDKFLLPDFWKTLGINIIKLVRKGSIHPQSARCGNDVTFKEFIDYVVLQDGAMKQWGQDKHWLPASAMCRQDIFRPHVVMKQENLSKEVPAVLKKLNLTWVLDKMSKLNMTEFEMNDQVQYVYKIGGLGCATPEVLAELIWKAYKYNAYIPTDVPFPREKFKGKFDPSTVLQVLNEVRSKWEVTKEERKKQKRDAMVAAYKTVPVETLYKLRDVYMDDFKTFGYEPEPSDIFS